MKYPLYFPKETEGAKLLDSAQKTYSICLDGDINRVVGIGDISCFTAGEEYHFYIETGFAPIQDQFFSAACRIFFNTDEKPESFAILWVSITKNNDKLKPLNTAQIRDYIKNNIESNIIHEEVDYKQLLKKYAEHVRQSEGIDFLDRLNSYESDVKFTDEEVKVLNEFNQPL